MSLFGNQNNSGGSSMFGQNNQSQPNKPPALKLFGISNTATPGTSSGTSTGLFGTSNQQSNTSGSLFGNNSNSNNNNGNTNNNQSTTQPSGGLFGGSSQPQQSGSLFGNTQPQPQAQNPNQNQAAGGLFGASSTTQQPSGGLFGSTNNQNQTGGSVFGGAQSQPANQSGGATFGGANMTSQPNQSLFGGNQSTSTGNLFASSANNTLAMNSNQQKSSLFGGYNPNASQPTTGGLPSLRFSRTGERQPQASIPGVRIDLSNMRSTTRFTDLHEEVQKVLIEVEKTVEGQIKLHNQISAVLPQHQVSLESIPTDVGIITGEAETVEVAIYNDSATIKQAKDLSAMDIEHAQRCFHAIEALKMPLARTNWASRARETDASAADADSEKQGLVSYFKDSAEEMTKTLAQYEKYITEIETHLRTVEANTIAQSQQALFTQGADGRGRSSEDQVRELATVLREFDGGIRGVAGKVGGVRDEVQKLTLRPKARR